MKNKIINHGHEEARIYARNYKPSLNIFRLLRTVWGVFVSGQSPAAHKYLYRRK